MTSFPKVQISISNKDNDELSLQQSKAMEKLAILTIGDGNFEQGFDRVTLEIYEQGEITQSPPHQFSGQLPPSSDLPRLYQQWQEQYDELTGFSRGRGFIKSQRTHLSISEDSRQIRSHLNQ